MRNTSCAGGLQFLENIPASFGDPSGRSSSRILGCPGEVQHLSDTRSRSRLTNYVSRDFVTLSLQRGSLSLSLSLALLAMRRF